MTDKTEAERHARENPEQAAKELRESEQRAAVYHMALRMYTDEPCRICGRRLTMDDIRAGAVFAGYSDDNSSRGAHRRCWAGMVDVATALLKDGREDLLYDEKGPLRAKVVARGDEEVS